MGSYTFSELAVKDLNEICEFIGKTNVKAASKLFDSIRKRCTRIFGLHKTIRWELPTLLLLSLSV